MASYSYCHSCCLERTRWRYHDEDFPQRIHHVWFSLCHFDFSFQNHHRIILHWRWSSRECWSYWFLNLPLRSQWQRNWSYFRFLPMKSKRCFHVVLWISFCEINEWINKLNSQKQFKYFMSLILINSSKTQGK